MKDKKIVTLFNKQDLRTDDEPMQDFRADKVLSISAAKNDEVLETYYKSIEIEKGDSLWDIAQEYKADNESTASYIKALMSLNNLTSDTIHEGQHLVVAYQEYVR